MINKYCDNDNIKYLRVSIGIGGIAYFNIAILLKQNYYK